MPRYSSAPGIVIQRNGALPQGISVAEYLRMSFLQAADAEATSAARVADALQAASATQATDAQPSPNINPEQPFIVLSHQGSVYSLNLSASIIFEEISKGTSVAQLVKIISELFEAPEEKIQQSVRQTLMRLLDQGVLLDQAS